MIEVIKVCAKCKNQLPVDKFSKRSDTKDGLQRWCRSCGSQYYKANKKTILARSLKWHRNNPEKARKAVRKWEKKNPEKAYAYKMASILKYQANNPEKRKAHWTVSYAVKTGKLLKEPCEVCGEVKVEGHHWSYLPEHWLDVKWLCRKHHNEEHEQLSLEKEK